MRINFYTITITNAANVNYYKLRIKNMATMPNFEGTFDKFKTCRICN
jgi:hypothetical protein